MPLKLAPHTPSEPSVDACTYTPRGTSSTESMMLSRSSCTACCAGVGVRGSGSERECPGHPGPSARYGHHEEAVCGVAGVARVLTELVWDPPWDREKMSEAARLTLGLL